MCMYVCMCVHAHICVYVCVYTSVCLCEAFLYVLTLPVDHEIWKKFNL